MISWVRRLLFGLRESNDDSAKKNPASPLLSDNQFAMANSKVLIVGLGNPGRKYRGTRHNIGFMAVDQLASSWGVVSDRSEQKAVVAKVNVGDRSVILAKPQTFMNSSGDSVGPLAKYYNIEPKNVLVIYDEIDLEFGVLRIRPKGGAAGHNGMRSIIQHLGNEFPRIRLGVGRPNGKMPVHAYVLQDFKGDELTTVEIMLRETVDAVETFLQGGIDISMNRHNTKKMKNDD